MSAAVLVLCLTSLAAQQAGGVQARTRVLVLESQKGAASTDALYGGFSALGVPPVDPDDRMGLDVPAPARAFETSRPDEARDALFAARAAFTEFDVEGADEKLDEAEAALLRLEAPEGQTDLFAEVLLLRAEVGLAAGARDVARQALRRLNRLQPEREELHPGLYAPALVELYAEARAANLDAPSATLVVLPRAPGVDQGSVLGDAASPQAPGTRMLPAGWHLVTVRAPGRLTRSAWVELDPGNPVVLEPLLSPEAADEKRAAARAALVDEDPAGDAEAAASLLALTGASFVVVEREGGSVVYAQGGVEVVLPAELPDDPLVRAQRILSAFRAGPDAAGEAPTRGGGPPPPVGALTTPGVGAAPGAGSGALPDEAEDSYAVPVALGAGGAGAAVIGVAFGSAILGGLGWWYYASIPRRAEDPPPRSVLITCCNDPS